MRLVVAAAVALGALLAGGQPRFSTEYEIKAAIVFNLTQFIEWPAKAFSAPDAPLVIGVLGQNPFNKSLDRVAEGETVQKRSVVIKYGETVDALGPVHILYISRSETRRIPEIVKSAKGKSTLTVSDVERFAQNGGMVNLVTAGERVRMVVNPRAIEDAGLRASSKLLRIAELVRTD